MAPGERCCVYFCLIALLALMGSLSAIPQTFGPLIRQRTSEEELHDNIGAIYRQDYRTPASAVKQPELVTRADGRNQRVKKPVDSNDPSVLSVVRDEDGKLVAVFGSTSNTSNAPPEQVPASNDRILVLRVDGVNRTIGDDGTTGMGPTFAPDSYPPDYPHERIQYIMRQGGNMYGDAFEKKIAPEALVPRIDSPADKYLCSSSRSIKYPTYHEQSKLNIVNVDGFYQQVTFETCDNHGALCSNAIASSNGKLICQQVSADYDVYTVPVDNSNKLIKTKLKFPSCCKCKHVP